MNNKSAKIFVLGATLVSLAFILLVGRYLSKSKTMSFNQEKDSFKSYFPEYIDETGPDTSLTTGSESSSVANISDSLYSLETIMEEQQKRQDTLKAKCAKINRNNLWDKVNTAKYLQNNARKPRLFYSDKHKIIVCGVPKCASTEWRKALLIIEGDVQVTSPEEIDLELSFSLAMQKRFLWNITSFKELDSRLNKYFRIMTVREPLERVVSAYIDKMLPGGTAVSYYQQMSQTIHKTFAKNKENFEEGWATFEEFVDNILYNPGIVDIHWQYYSSICNPCNMHYNYIAKLETSAQDFTYIAEKTEIKKILLFDGKGKPRTNSQEKHGKYEKYLKELPKEKLRRLFQLYKTQYELFDYPFPSYL